MLASSVVNVPEDQDVHEWMDVQNWGDGLPIVPPTVERVRRMLTGTRATAESRAGEARRFRSGGKGGAD